MAGRTVDLVEGRTVLHSFIQAKLHPPRIDMATTVDRPTLQALLNGALDRQLTCVVAPAGFGKTTVLANWLRGLDQGRVCAAWLTLESHDNDPWLFVQHIFQAIATAIGDSHLDPGTSRDGDCVATAQILAQKLAGVQRPVVLVLDDYHKVSNATVDAFLNALLQIPGGCMNLVLSSRAQPDLKMGLLRANGRVLEIGLDELRFSPDEAKNLLRRNIDSPIDAGALSTIVARTEGWVAGLRLAAIGINRTGPDWILTSSANDDMRRLLVEEVIDTLSEDIVDFLLDTAVLGNFNADLCDHVRGCNNSLTIIDEICARQLFIGSLHENGWYRYHTLFAASLRQQLHRVRPTRAAEVHRQAAIWYEQRGLPIGAIEHSFDAGDMEAAAACLERHASALIHSGRSATLLLQSARLPPEIAACHPELQLERGYAHMLAWQFSDAKRLLGEARAVLARGHSYIDAVHSARLERRMIFLEMQLVVLIDAIPQAAALGRHWLTLEGPYTPFEDAAVQTELIYAEREMFSQTRLASSAQAREIFIHHGERWGLVWHLTVIGACYARIGDLDSAETHFSEAVAAAEAVGGRTSTLTAMPMVHLAEIHYERNRADDAQVILDEFLPLATRTGLVDQAVAAFRTNARLAGRRSTDQALAIIQAGEELAVQRDFERLRIFMLLERVTLLAAAGELSEIRRIARLNDMTGDCSRFLPATGSTTVMVAQALIAATVSSLNNRLGEASTLLRRWLRFLTDRNVVSLALKVASTLGHVQILEGDERSARRTLRAMLQLGLPAGFLASLLEAPATVREQFAAMASAEPGNPHLTSLMEALGQKLPPGKAVAIGALAGLSDRLNDREAEILLMVATGRMNAEIAQTLGLTLSTVKWYLQQIYGKMGVNRRSEAVYKARRLGLIG